MIFRRFDSEKDRRDNKCSPFWYFAVALELSTINVADAMAAIEAEARAIVEMVGRQEEAAALREATQQNGSSSANVQQSQAEQVNGIAAPAPTANSAEDTNAQQTEAETPMDVDQPGKISYNNSQNSEFSA